MTSAVTVVPGWFGVLGGVGDSEVQLHSPGILLCKRWMVTNEQGRVIVLLFVAGGEGQFFC